MMPELDFASHRAAVLAQLAQDEAVLLFGSPHALRNGDTEYRYRPDSDVFWLTGWTDPEVAVFLRPGEESFVLFCQDRNPVHEQWNGPRPGPEGAMERFGASAAFPMEELDLHLPRLLQGVSCLHYQFAQDPRHDTSLLSAIRKATQAAKRNGLSIPETFHSPSRMLHELRLHKAEDEVAVLRESARICALAHRAVMSATAPGCSERELEALLHYIFRSQGGTGPGYVPIVAGGSHATVLHYITNDAPLADGDLVLVDAGVEFQYYTTDVTRTYPVNGVFTDTQRDVYTWVLRAQKAAIQAAVPGRPFTDIYDTAIAVLTEGLVALGVLEGDVEQLVADGDHKKFTLHGTSHWLGLDVHDVGSYGRSGESRPLAAGMVLTVEPGLYFPADDPDIAPNLRGIGIRIEDDVLITDSGNEVLTDGIPKEIAEVEAACAATWNPWNPSSSV